MARTYILLVLAFILLCQGVASENLVGSSADITWTSANWNIGSATAAPPTGTVGYSVNAIAVDSVDNRTYYAMNIGIGQVNIEQQGK